ncbi:hypothetical protein JRO89_XS01G0346300 [Xanthoceras sorbifolium]|uniref:Peptidase C1A papain C-terminal domain-containing protein n=1 Tax=Xanthoceras sorbifolium TaxID=99658 RepID=A0ABQ8IN60_9ROSI|nr:hypothetical protein JRO89_XS01G0346300 [Xanthoceras sorbifolium]
MASPHLLFASLLLLFAAISTQAIASEPVSKLKLNSKILQDSIIKQVNENPKAGWEAARNPQFSNYTVGEFKYLLGVKPMPKKELLGVPVVTYDKSLKLPDSFDARTAWPQCSSIGRILGQLLAPFFQTYFWDSFENDADAFKFYVSNGGTIAIPKIRCLSVNELRSLSMYVVLVIQGHCGSCWAFGAVESLSDRFCIHFGTNISLSVNDLLACCGIWCGDGCDGGYPIYAWRYFMHHGVVTEECDPYFDDIGCSHPGCEPAFPTPKCVKKCVNKNQLWRNSKHYSVSAYRIGSHPKDIMAEVYQNGPVEVAFTVYEDFAHYKSGVYKHITGGVMGGHAVKLIGWGTSADGEDYWLLANQWNKGWGDDGYFKIKRGANECGIEEDAVAGLPSTKNLVREVVGVDSFKDASASL